jgi:3-hydroxyacyl-[acyl-carrier-protein] dehydratase
VVAVTTLTIAAEHPALVGHFPGMPIVPGVVLLDEMLQTLAAQDGAAGTVWRIGAAKFVKLVRPGELLTLAHEQLDNGSIRFSIARDGQPVAHGVIVPVHRNPQDESAGS